jgi:nicotinate-nucleotide adenylyltransferase
VTVTAVRIGILGGTFDPIHRGHVELAEAAWTALGLTRLYLVPAHYPPHRPAPVASAYHRFAMVALAVAGRPEWLADDVELGSAEPSYTVSTLRTFHQRGYRSNDLFFITGADAFREIATWRNYPAILDDANFAVVSRPGFPVGVLAGVLPTLAPRMARPPARPSDGTSIFLIDAPTSDVSSTAIREACASGRGPGDMVPPVVRQHIDQHALYRSPLASAESFSRPPATAAGRMHGQG